MMSSNGSPEKGPSDPCVRVDLTGLNRYIKGPAYPTRILITVVATIPQGMTVFTVLDSRHGYWQVPLDDESSKLTTFMTPWEHSVSKETFWGFYLLGTSTIGVVMKRLKEWPML